MREAGHNSGNRQHERTPSVITFTKDNGEIVNQDYARRRIVSCRGLRTYNLPLSTRQQVAEKIVNDRGYNGVLVSYLCSIAFEEYVDMLVPQGVAP